ncbi:DNA topoisomerase IB [Dokdonella koreensis]|uniref:DNA topoisomerase n=1 Tax=Dokdonella koreensis DS-123 TaxID=1300342 RepID=A0A160DWZ2_9GAMM|nr:DNA topoisomerase IB [Dokdonella koreensis]ANB18453.1 Putative DNA topoisomerase [Dokdonella koreensis DS-123]
MTTRRRDRKPPRRPPQDRAAQDEAAIAREAGLVHVRDDAPGIRRRRSGAGFIYLDADGTRIRDAAQLARIRALAVPPAYTEVWICRDPRGHLQATGRDARRRKQYRYHARWRVFRDRSKFVRLVAFGQALPRLRRRLRRDLALPGLPCEKVVAVVVSLLAETLARVGNEAYARDNRSFGLTTLRNRHVASLRGGRLSLRFRGKGGLEHAMVVDDQRLARIVARCHQLPGQLLFQYLDEDGVCQPVDSGQVNAYLRDAMGEDFTAKDFRTWGGTLLAVAALARTPLPDPGDERALAAGAAAVVREVAAALRNTPAVCRTSYIDPRVFDVWRRGRLHRLASQHGSGGPRRLEGLALRVLRDRPGVGGRPSGTPRRRAR